jgi:hypothetical protein
MLVNLQGLTFETHSPSRFRLTSVREDAGCGDTVDVAFTGMSWAIVYQPGNARLPIFRPFASRDEAVALIASRRP